MKRLFKNFKSDDGFTIIELVISIFVLSIAISGIFSAFSIMLILTSDSANRLTAIYLAQEGMEIVRNIRDNNWLNMDTCAADSGCTPNTYTWLDGLNCVSGCEADYTLTELHSFSGDYLKIDANGFYNSTGGVQTKFERKIIITQIPDVNNQPDDHIIKVIAQVSWDQKATILNPGVKADTCNQPGGPSNCITVEETLYDWYNYVNQ